MNYDFGGSGSKLSLDPISDMQVVVSGSMCEPPTFLRWKRSHRRSRINKKWHKKYGAVMKPCPGRAFQLPGCKLVVCPHVNAMLRKLVPS